jgi:hypothetical protein
VIETAIVVCMTFTFIVLGFLVASVFEHGTLYDFEVPVLLALGSMVHILALILIGLRNMFLAVVNIIEIKKESK